MSRVNREDSPLRIKTVSQALCRINSNSSTSGSVTVRASVLMPSRRLSCMISLAFESGDGQTPNGFNSSTWVLRAIRRNEATGRRARLHTLASESLPSGYELDSAIREVEVEATLKAPLTAGSAAIAGEWVLLVEWEPNQPSMCEEEIRELFSYCEATVQGTTSTVAA